MHAQQFSCVALYDYCVLLKEEQKSKEKNNQKILIDLHSFVKIKISKCSLHLFLDPPVNANSLKNLKEQFITPSGKKINKWVNKTLILKVDPFVGQAIGTFSKRPTPFRPLKTALRISRAKITRVCRVSYLTISCTYNARGRLLRLKGV
jgi:hypothetical protein